ncbi:WD repeat-containing protein 5 homolog, partial [Durusdinium trenchii]
MSNICTLHCLSETIKFAALACELSTGEVRCVTTLESGGVAFGSMETWLLTSEKDRVGADNLIRVYETLGPPPRLLSGHQRRAGVDGVLALAAVPGTGRLVSAGRDGRIIVWQDGQEVADLKGHGENMEGTNVHVVSALAMTKDGCLISGGWDKTVRLWENQSQKYMMTGHEIAINAVAGLANGDVASGSGDQSIGIWRDGQKLKSLQAKQVVRALCALDGSLLCAGTNDGCMRVWDTNSGQMLAERRVAQ